MGLSPIPIPGMGQNRGPEPLAIQGTATEPRHAQAQAARDPDERIRGVMAEVRNMRTELEGLAREFPEASAEAKTVSEGLMAMLTKIATARRGPEGANLGTPSVIGAGG